MRPLRQETRCFSRSRGGGRPSTTTFFPACSACRTLRITSASRSWSTSGCSSAYRPNFSRDIPKSFAPSRNRVPAEITSNPWAFAKRSATVVFPLPGGPLIAMIIGVLILGRVPGGGFPAIVPGLLLRFLQGFLLGLFLGRVLGG